MKRRLLTLGLILILSSSCFVGCGSGKKDNSETESQQTESQTTQSQKPEVQPQAPSTQTATTPSGNGGIDEYQASGSTKCFANIN